MNKDQSLFIELVAVALGNRKQLSITPSESEWRTLFDVAQKQAVAAFLLPAVDILTNYNQSPPAQLVYEWIGIGVQTASYNKIVNQRCQEISSIFYEAGFRSCVLKGQGNSLLYDQPFSRSPGDIDIWIDSDRETIRNFVIAHCAAAKDSNLHIDYPVFKDVPVEVHYRPTIARSHKYNKKLQLFYDSLADDCFRNKVSVGDSVFSVPVPELNVIMQMSHVMNHFFEEGIGLRQIIDMYYLLKKSSFDRLKMANELVNLGMGRFSRAVMWVLHQKLGLEEEFLVALPDKRRGRLLLEDILLGGNFGRYGTRQHSDLYRKSPLVYKIKRNIRFVWLFPMEAFISPFAGKCFRNCIVYD
jgi:hypothetical protein